VQRRRRLGGKYVSLSITVRVRAPEIVGRVYDELAKDGRVKMRF
jgi:putative lipoic acid-binding regulatory protein